MAAALYNKDPKLRTTLLHEFTDEELGIKDKPLRWEDLGNVGEYYIDNASIIVWTGKYKPKASNINLIPCVKDAMHILAHCQLLQLAKYYNKCDQHEIGSFYLVASYKTESKTIEPHALTGENIYGSQIKFRNKSELEKCIEDNRDLWETYLGVK